jgi:hypothetical protein
MASCLHDQTSQRSGTETRSLTETFPAFLRVAVLNTLEQ